MKNDSLNSNFDSKHNLILEGRKNLKINGVNELGTFDEKNIVIFLNSDRLQVIGKNLKVKKLSVETGDIEIFGIINSLVYSDRKKNTTVNFISKLFGNK